jgi:hypothetical protein
MANVHLATNIIPTVVDVSANSTVVTADKARLWGIYVNTALSAHACPIENSGGTAIYTLIASLAAGTKLTLPGVLMDGITVDPNDAATGNITIEWSPA